MTKKWPGLTRSKSGRVNCEIIDDLDIPDPRFKYAY